MKIIIQNNNSRKEGLRRIKLDWVLSWKFVSFPILFQLNPSLPLEVPHHDYRRYCNCNDQKNK